MATPTKRQATEDVTVPVPHATSQDLEDLRLTAMMPISTDVLGDPPTVTRRPVKDVTPKAPKIKASKAKTRECTQCREAKPFPDAFYKLADASGGLDGFTKRCKDCYKASRGSGTPRLGGKAKDAAGKGTLVNFVGIAPASKATPVKPSKAQRASAAMADGIKAVLPPEAFKK